MRTDVLHFQGGFLLLACLLFCPLSQAEAAKPVPVIIKKVVITRFTDRVEALGTLRAKETAGGHTGSLQFILRMGSVFRRGISSLK